MKDKIILSKENIETLAELVKPYLTEKRYEHTLSVKREAERLGEIFLPDEVNRLAASALLHDITKKADAKKLILTHFSNRYENLEEVESEARVIFPNTNAAYDFYTFKIDYSE